VTDRDHPPDALVKRLARNSAAPNSVTITSASLRNVVTTPSCKRRTILLIAPSRALAGSAIIEWPRDRHQRTANEIALSAGASDINARGDLRVYLSGEIDFDCRVYRDEFVEPAQNFRAMGMRVREQADRAIVMREAMKPLSSRQKLR